MPVYPSGGTIAQSVGSPGFGPAPAPVFNASASVRFNPADTAYFSYIPTLQGSRTTWTWSGWVKRSGLVSGGTFNNSAIFTAGTSNPGFILAFDKDTRNDAIQVNITRGTNAGCLTNALFRDVSAWYHIVVAFDTTQATAANRIKLWVNGVEQTWFQTSYPSQYSNHEVNNTSVHNIGRASQSSSEYFNGYLADINFVDGLALTPSSFTSTDANTGQLVPAQYTGSFGRNGFYLPFSGAALAVDLGQNPKTTAQDFPYWPYNTLLVDTTSTNGAQNNTFLDSSTNNFTITRNGNTTQGNFTPFTFGGGTTQANGYYSGYFDGTGDYLTVANNAALDPNTDSFCMECWVYITGTTGNNQGFNGKGVAGTSGYSFYITNALLLSFIWNGTGGATITGGTLSLNTWNHVAVVRNSGVIRLYLNGVGAASSTACTTDINSTNGLFIGQARGGNPILGYMSNYRMTKGTLPSGYDATATTLPVPTAPLTAITNTSLLTCQSSQFIDNSANAFAITANGNSQPLPTNPFGMTAWSGYFDGTGDYLTAPYSASLDLTQGNFTVEAWVYRSVAGTVDGIICQRPSGSPSTTGWAFRINAANTLQFFYTSGSTVTSTATIPSGVWTYVAATRSGGTTYLFIDGQLTTSASFSNGTSAANTTLTVVGAENDFSGSMSGNISNLRVINGTALYTSNFTPPTAPLTAISGTSLLTCQSSTFIDNSTNAFAITVNGNSYTGTLNNPFGNPMNYTTPPVQGWSTYFDGSGDYISTTPTALTYGIGTGLFTWESWIYTVNSSATAQGIWHYYTTVTDIIYPYIVSSTGTFNCTLRATNQAVTTISAPAGVIRLNQWHHVVVTRDSATNISLYVDGKKVAGGTIAASTSFADTVMNTSNGNNPVIGAQTNTLREYFYGYISNLRFVRGSAVYTGNFTPPTAPLTAIPGTMTLACQSNRVLDNSILNAAQVANGNTSISSRSPFIPTQAWSAASYGGTMYFDGSDYLTAPHDASLSPTGNFTIEFWAYNTGSTAVQEWVTKGFGIQIYSFNSLWYAAFSSNNTTTYFVNASFGTSLFNTWQHIAVTRSGNTYTGFVNGVATSLGTSASAPGTGTNLFAAGVSIVGTPYYVTGYMSGLRVINGTAIYTTPFVPPVLPPTAVTNTALLLNATNSGIYDATGQNVLETVGNAQVSTAVKKWGESSLYLDGSGDYVVIPTANAPCQFGTADFTIEAWIYSTTIGNQQMILSNRIAATGSANFDLQLVASKLRFGTTSTDLLVGTITLSSNTWYHVAVSRVSGTTRQFINGVLDTSTTTSFNLSNNSITHIGTNATYSPTQYPFVGYIQDMRLSKGVGRYSGAFTPPAAAFAYNQYDIGNQQWLPNNVSVTAGVGQDNMVDSPSDYGTDTGLGGQVRGNYCTMNPLNVNLTLSNGALDATIPGSTTANHQGMGTFGVSSGKWYFEVRYNSIGGSGIGTIVIGVAKLGTVTTVNNTVNGQAWSYYGFNGQKYHTSGTAYGNTFAPGDTIGVALDMDNGKIWFSKNGVFQASGDPVAGTNAAFTNLTGQTVTPWVGDDSSSAPKTFTTNFGQRAFSYTAPSGFKCLVSTNLPTTNGIGATSSTRASNYFNANIWTGNGTQIPVGFDPSLIWYKSTNAVSFGGWVDQIRGDNYYMQTWDTAASTLSSGLLTTNSTGFVPGSAFAANSYVSYGWRGADTLSWSFDGSLERTATMTIASPCVVTLASNGFSAGQAVRFTTTGALPTGIVAGTTYYAGNMVGSTFNLYDTEANAITGGAAGRVNTSGSQSGTQTCEHAAKTSANPTSGFSVTQYIGVGGTTTVPHGLGAAPEMYIIKCASTTGNWLTLTTALDGSVDYAYLNGTQNLTNAGPGFSTLPTSTVVSLGTDPDANTNGVTYMLYSYVSIPGFSKVGVYTGNGAADGPMIYTNFSPEMLMLKRVSGTPVDSWYNLDLPRDPYNVVSNFLAANSSQAQSSATFVDFLSNGFKVRAAGAYQNAAGSSYLYLAIASAPFKYSRAR